MIHTDFGIRLTAPSGMWDAPGTAGPGSIPEEDTVSYHHNLKTWLAGMVLGVLTASSASAQPPPPAGTPVPKLEAVEPARQSPPGKPLPVPGKTPPVPSKTMPAVPNKGTPASSQQMPSMPAKTLPAVQS